MDKLIKQVQTARRRMILQQFLFALPWCLFAALLAAAAVIAVPKFFAFEVDSTAWAVGWLGGGVVVAVLAAMVWTFLHRQEPLDAAVAIDHRFKLKERVSSAVALDERDRNTAAGRALEADAVRRAGRIDVREQFGVSLTRSAWLPLVPAVLAFCLAMFVQDRVLQNPAEAKTSAADIKQAKKSTDELRRRLAERRKTAREKKLKAAEKWLTELEDRTTKLNERKDLNPKKVLAELNDLKRVLEKRHKSLGGNELKKQFAGLKNLKQGPAEKLAKALRQGNLNKALDELKKLQEQLKAGDLDKEDLKKLAEQFQQMQEKLERLAKEHQNAMDQLQKQINEMKQGGKLAEANELQKQLDKLAQQMPQMQQLQKLADKMGQCKDCMKQGNAGQAMAALGEMVQDLENLEQAMDELEMLDDALDQIAMAKDAMRCKQCAGAGCGACNGQGGEGQGGDGLGAGRGGRGPRPEEKGKTGSFDTHVRQNVGKGKAVITDFGAGPNAKGKVREHIKSELETAKALQADPLTNKRLPRSHRDHAAEYFKAFQDE